MCAGCACDLTPRRCGTKLAPSLRRLALRFVNNQFGEPCVLVPGGRLMSSKDSGGPDAVGLRLVFGVLLLMAVLIVQSCTAFNPQGAAIQQAPNYYNQSYSQLSPEQKMQLEDHLANQSNQRSEEHTSALQSPCHLVCR